MFDAISTATGKARKPVDVFIHRDVEPGSGRLVARSGPGRLEGQHLRQAATGRPGHVGHVGDDSQGQPVDPRFRRSFGASC